jgi:photosynthetic reaction center cytochrome c subunit
MKHSWTIGVVAVLVVVLAGWKGRAAQSQQAAPTVAASAGKEPSNQEINDAFVQRISKQIAGHEQEPSGQVFKNIQVDFLKKAPAGRLLLIMNEGYSRALGVNCKHCHVEEDFSKDDKRPKRCARDMALMHFDINQRLVKMQNLEPNPNGHFINCATCHRGQIDPMAHGD